jgi:dihydrodipicolinate synthase/N-acetylneuraminate lyase
MSRKSLTLEGILAAVTTPFTADGSSIDFDTLTAQANRLIGAGIHGLVPTGTTGEFTSLSPEEHRQVIKAYVDAAAGRVPVIAGIGSLTTAGAVALAVYSEEVGADAVMLVPPFYDPLDFASLKAFYTAVSEATDLPIMYYNVPGATGVRLNAAQIAELGSIPGVDYLKDTSGDAVTLTDLIVNRADSIQAFNGWDTLTFIGLALGAKASVWGVAGVLPEQAVEFYETLAVKGDLVTARQQWKSLWLISDYLESVNYVAGVKTALDILGHPVGPARAPVQPLPAEERAKLAAILKQVGATVVRP